MTFESIIAEGLNGSTDSAKDVKGLVPRYKKQFALPIMLSLWMKCIAWRRHRFLLKETKRLDASGLCASVKKGVSPAGRSAETSKRQAAAAGRASSGHDRGTNLCFPKGVGGDLCPNLSEGCSAEISVGEARDAFPGEKGQILRKALRYTPCISQRRLTLQRIASRICAIGGLALAAVALVSLPLAGKEPIMPLSEVQPGMEGEWKSVVSGTQIESFPLEVLGIAKNFIGPKRSLIICQATDPKFKEIGLVQGMSGSPVYIENRLVGAYAYGFSWSKDQSIIGVTPIEQMLEVLEDYPTRAVVAAAPSPPLIEQWRSKDQGRPGEIRDWRITESDGRLDKHEFGALFQPVPTPLLVSGISERTLASFRGEFERVGLEVLRAPSGSASEDAEFSLEPGSSVAAVLMNGDFNAAFTGTVTYRDGDTLLAFGHPIDQMGQVQLPMAGAEIITIVQTFPASFKISNTGPLVGSIYQDRLAAVAGLVGELPPLLPYRIGIRAENGRRRQYMGNLLEHQTLTPLFAGLALLQSIYATMESSEEQTLFVKGKIELEEYGSVEFEDVSTGPMGGMNLVFSFVERMHQLLGNPFHLVALSDIAFDIELRDEWLVSGLRSVQLENRRVKAGEQIEIVVTLYNYRNEPSRHWVSLPVPKGLKSGQELTVLVADAAEAERVDGIRDTVATSVEEIIAQWGGTRSRQAAYVMLLQESPGLRYEGNSMFDLPPSIRALYTSPGNNIVVQALEEVSLAETEIPVEGEFRGTFRLPVTLE